MVFLQGYLQGQKRFGRLRQPDIPVAIENICSLKNISLSPILLNRTYSTLNVLYKANTYFHFVTTHFELQQRQQNVTEYTVC